MGADRPDEFDVPSAEFGDRSPDMRRSRGFDRDANATGSVAADVESRDRDSYYEDLQRAAWDEAAEHFKKEWAEHQERWPDAARERVDRSEDPEGSWRGDSGRFLDKAANAEVEERYQRITETERDIVSPAMREIEASDPDRRLVGFDHRLKGLDRLKDKVAEDIFVKSHSAEDALAGVKDAVRYTLQYDTASYTSGVRSDVERLQASGFEKVELRNSWADDHYKGINSRWRDPDSGLLFEVQFHTSMSFEAKQLTHGNYERLRNPMTSDAEREELYTLQQKVCRSITIPADATEILDVP